MIWNKESDVVVIGYGGAGATAAITVSEEGGAVIILEKAPQPGGNTSVSTGAVRLPTDAGKIAHFLESTGLGTIDNDMSREFADTWIGLEDWFSIHGARFTVTDSAPKWAGVFPGAEALDKKLTMDRSDEWTGVGRDLFDFLASAVRKHEGIEVMLNTPAQRLVQDSKTGEILGVIANNGNKEIHIKVKKAIIMACGGFEANRDMIATYIEEAPVPIAVSGTPYNTGDGIKMAMDVGADLWHMNGIEWSRAGFKPSELPAAFWLDPKSHGWINVNREGLRFRDESESYAHTKKHLEVFHFDRRKGIWLNHPWYMIFDEKTRKAGPIIMLHRSTGRAPFVTYNLGRELYDWSPDNSKETEKGWIKRGETFAELAQKAGIDPAGLEKTMARYNAFCREGVDSDFCGNRKRLTPIDVPPYYSIECTVNIINTQGGPRRNSRGQVMDPYGAAIPRLYAAGECGSVYGFVYPGGCNLPECIVSGIIAGQNGVAEGAQ